MVDGLLGDGFRDPMKDPLEGLLRDGFEGPVKELIELIEPLMDPLRLWPGL